MEKKIYSAPTMEVVTADNNTAIMQMSDNLPGTEFGGEAGESTNNGPIDADSKERTGWDGGLW